MPKLSKTQIGYLTRFENHVDIRKNVIFDKSFQVDVELLRADQYMASPVVDGRGTEYTSPLADFLVKYKFPVEMKAFIHRFVVTNAVEPDLLKNNIYLVSERDETASGDTTTLEENYHQYVQETQTGPWIELTLAITPNTNITQIRDLITENKDFIEEKQRHYSADAGKRASTHHNAKRDRRIEELSKTLKVKDIERQLYKEGYNMSSTEIYKVTSKLRNAKPRTQI